MIFAHYEEEGKHCVTIELRDIGLKPNRVFIRIFKSKVPLSDVFFICMK